MMDDSFINHALLLSCVMINALGALRLMSRVNPCATMSWVQWRSQGGGCGGCERTSPNFRSSAFTKGNTDRE